MKAARIHQFGPVSEIHIESTAVPTPAGNQVLVEVAAAGVGYWDALIRTGQAAEPKALPITLGSDLAGTVVSTGDGVTRFRPGDAVYGATNHQFTGAHAQFALAESTMLGRKPSALSFIEAASAPVVACTAWQMLFDYAHLTAGQRVLIHGAAGNVGAYAVQLAHMHGIHVIAAASPAGGGYVRGLGADEVIDYGTPFEARVTDVDAVLDTIGGDTRDRSYSVLKRNGILVTITSDPLSEDRARQFGVRTAFFLVDVTAALLDRLTSLFDAGTLKAHVGSVVPFDDVRRAHEMLAGAPHEPGKIVLRMTA
jgi:NADPH:quinone reductase-like Zn-dependent oxidoreductase